MAGAAFLPLSKVTLLVRLMAALLADLSFLVSEAEELLGAASAKLAEVTVAEALLLPLGKVTCLVMLVAALLANLSSESARASMKEGQVGSYLSAPPGKLLALFFPLF